MPTPAWALTLSFWLHMLATVTWVGGLGTLALLVFPIAHRTLEPQAYADFVRRVNKRLDPLGWFGLSLLTVTGLIQMSANPNYLGFLAFENRWAQAILFKHIALLGIILISAYQTWNLAPQLERQAMLRSRGKQPPGDDNLQRRETRLLTLNLILGVAVLLLTALARVAA